MIDPKQPITSLVVDKGDAENVAAETGAGKTNQTKANPGKTGSAKKSGSKNRRKSRELVLKAVYRGMLNQSELSQIFRDMTDDPDYNKADEAYFRQLLEGVTTHLNDIDDKIGSFIDRPLAELSPIEHAILRIAGCELMFDLSIPYRVVINEGVELAKLFGGTDGHKYINGVLDKFAAAVREAEVKAARN